MKKIKSASELPEWFKLEKYAKTASLSAFEWHQQFFIRITANAGSTLIDEELIPFVANELEDDLNDYYADLKMSIRKNPIIDIHMDGNFAEFKDAPPYLSLNSNNPSSTAGLHSLTAFEYLLLGSYVDKHKLLHMQKWWHENYTNNKVHEITKAPAHIDSPLHEVYHEHSYNIGMEAVWIDLAYPDHILIKHFEHFLKIRRSEFDSTSKNASFYNKVDFDNWHRFGVLPYIDLIMWARDERVKIPYRVLADAIFPSGERGEETIRKTTKPLTQSLLNQSTLTQLETLILKEIAEQKSQ